MIKLPVKIRFFITLLLSTAVLSLFLVLVTKQLLEPNQVMAHGGVMGDLNNDNRIDLGDLAILLAHFGEGAGSSVDLDGNGRVNLYDFNILIANFGHNHLVSNSPTPVASGNIAPYPSAPLCPDSGAAHDANKFHTLWDATRGCHYDHEHGQNPFTPAAAAVFPDFNLKQLMGNVEIGHTNLSGATENTLKHGGFKWNVQLTHPEGCTGFESATHGVNGSVIQYHNFGDYAVELEAAVHTSAALVRQCNVANPSDYGYLYVPQFQSYGEICVPYQGTTFVYPYYSVPLYDCEAGPYLTVNCIGNVTQCRSSLAVAQQSRASSNWSSKPTRAGARPQVSGLFRFLFRIENTYQNLDWNDRTHPFTFIWLCTSDGGRTFNPNGCRYNNSTSQVHEIAGDIPSSWDNLAGFDTDSRPGRITATGFVTRYGTLNQNCTTHGPDCHPIKLVRAFVGSYGSVLVYTAEGKGTNIVTRNASRDICFEGQTAVPCDNGFDNRSQFRGVPSGWIGTGN